MRTCRIRHSDPRVGDFFVCCPHNDTSVLPQLVAGHYEPHVHNLFSTIISDGMTVLDVGANFGQHSVVLSRLVGKNGSVIAIEASKNNTDYLTNTMIMNDCGNVKIINSAVWSNEDTLLFAQCNKAEATSFCSNKPDMRTIEPNPNFEYTEIKVTTLDKLVDSEVDFIKMDIEGSELFALRGAKRILRNLPPALVELNSFTSMVFNGVEIKEIVDYMTEIGYSQMRAYINGSWTKLDRQILLSIFEKGHVLIDVLFTN